MAEPVTAKDVTIMRAYLHALIGNAQKEAREKGKPLSIIAGERHGSQRSWLNNVLIVDEAQKLGIHRLGTESIDDEGVKWRQDHPLAMAFYAGMRSVEKLFPGMEHRNLEAGSSPDAKDFTSPQAMAARDANMSRNIDASGVPSVNLVGAYHLKGIYQKLQEAGHHVLILDAQDEPHILTGTDNADETFLKQSPHVHRLNITGDAHENSMQQLVGLAFGKDAEKKMAGLDAAGWRVSTGELVKEVFSNSRSIANFANPEFASSRSYAQTKLGAALQELSHQNPHLASSARYAYRQALKSCGTDSKCRAEVVITHADEPAAFQKSTEEETPDIARESAPKRMPDTESPQPETISNMGHLKPQIEEALRLYNAPEAAPSPPAVPTMAKPREDTRTR